MNKKFWIKEGILLDDYNDVKVLLCWGDGFQECEWLPLEVAHQIIENQELANVNFEQYGESARVTR